MPVMLTDLADCLNAAGVRVVEIPAWKNRGHGPMGDVQGIVMHHTAGPAAGECPSLNTVINGRPDLAGPLAHFVVGRSGTWYVVAAGRCWHAGATLQPWQANEHTIGVEAEGTGRDPWPDPQMHSLIAGTRALAHHYGVPFDRVRGHKEVCAPVGRKPDPNFDMPAFRRALTAPQEGDMPLSDADIDKIADRVWEKARKNGFGDSVGPWQTLAASEKRMADVQATLAERDNLK